MDISVRLKEERERLGMTQEAFGQSGGVLKRAVIHYERGERVPDALFLTRVAAAGADVLYILTGQRSRPVAPQDLLPGGDRILLDNFHAAPGAVQAGVKTTLSAFAPGAGKAGKRKAG